MGEEKKAKTVNYAEIQFDIKRDFRYTLIGLKFLEEKYGTLKKGLDKLVTKYQEGVDAKGEPVIKNEVCASVFIDFIYAGILHNQDAHIVVGPDIVPNWETLAGVGMSLDLSDLGNKINIIFQAINGTFPEEEKDPTI